MYGSSASNNTGGFNRAGGHPFFQDGEINPEELFRAFFGGGGASSGFHTFHMGGHPFFGSQPFVFQQRRRPRQQQPSNNASDFDGIRGFIRQLLPIIVFFIFSIVSSWLGSSSEPSVQSFEDLAELVSLTPGLGYPYSRTTRNLNVPYYATSSYQSHFTDFDASVAKSKTPPYKLMKALKHYEGIIEKYHVSDLQRRCKAEEKELSEKINKAKSSPEELKRLKSLSKPSCDKLHALGIKH